MKRSPVAWEKIVLVMCLCSMAVYLWIHNTYTTGLPHQPDIPTGRTIPLQAKGGIIYANPEEQRWWNWSDNAFFVGWGVAFITITKGLLDKKARGRISN